MATVKLFSDLGQSRKLAEILPLESADMYRVFENNAETRVYYGKMPTAYFVCKPCWSLASLLGVLPKRIELEGVAYELSIYLNGLYYWNVNNGNLLLEVKDKDNLVDACVAMIEKLHELKML